MSNTKYQIVITILIVIALWTAFICSRVSDPLHESPTSIIVRDAFEESPAYYQQLDTIHLQSLLVQEALILISGLLFLKLPIGKKESSQKK